MTATARTPLLASLLLCALVACGDTTPAGPAGSTTAAAPAAPAAAPADGTVQLLWLARAQSYLSGVPCDPEAVAPLPAAARAARALEAAGDGVILACFGDTLVQPASVTGAPAAIAVARARADVDLDAMAAAGVDVYVPGYADMAEGLVDLVDRATSRGIPVVLSNVEVPGRDDVLPYRVFDHGGVRIAVLGLIPRNNTFAPEGWDPGPGVTFTPPGRAVRRLSRRILQAGEANMIVCLSGLSSNANQTLCDIPDLHFLVGNSDEEGQRSTVAQRSGTTLFISPLAGRAVGHTTFCVEDDDWQLADLSARHVLPDQLERERETLAGYARQFGTDVPEELAPLIIPHNPSTFMLKHELMLENAAWLEEAEHWEGSYLDHRSLELEPVPADDPVLAVFARAGAAMDAAVAALDIVPEPLPDEMTIPKPQDCVSCHREQHDFWAATDHARAFETIADAGHRVDGSCHVCHATGFGLFGGYRDPRHEAPFGAVGCFDCHDVQAPHVTNARLVVDPLYVHASVEEMDCSQCHNRDRSPGFGAEAALPRVACPPMRRDDPVLVEARAGALDAIERARRRGNATDWEDYLEGRALVGIGKPGQGLPLMRTYMEGRTDWPAMTYSTAQFLEEHGDAPGGLELIRGYIAAEPGNLQMNIAYIRMLAESPDPDVRDPEHALSHARLIAPPDAEELTGVLIPAYLVQVEMLVDMGRAPEAYQLLARLAERFTDNEAVEAALDEHVRGMR